MSGQIIIVSGASGSGKSTTVQRWASRADDLWLMFGIDMLSGMMTPAKFSMHGPRSSEGQFAAPLDAADPDGPTKMRYGASGWRALEAFHAMIAAAAQSGCNIVVDHLMLLDPPILQHCIWALDGLPVLFVGLQPDKAVLLDRIGSRQITVPPDFAAMIGEGAEARIARNLQRMTPWFMDAVNANSCFDLVVDSSAHSPDAICDLLAARLGEGPGTAFDQLRKTYPQP